MDEAIAKLAAISKETNAEHISINFEQTDGSFVELNYWTRRPKGR